MRNPRGYFTSVDPDPSRRGSAFSCDTFSLTHSGTLEADTYRCCHCPRIVIVRPGAPASEMGGRCTCCDDFTCNRPECNASCVPLEKKLAIEEAVKTYV